MGRIANLVNQSRRLKTEQELRALIGQPLDPCPTCGCAIRSVLQDGSVICEECQPEAAARGVALRLAVLLDPDCRPTAHDWKAITEARAFEDELDAAAYYIQTDAGRMRIIPIDLRGLPIAARRMTADTYFESLPLCP